MSPSELVRDINLETLVLMKGGHKSLEEGACVMEAVSYIAGEAWSDHPKCASPVITSIMIGLNDRMTDDERQTLKPYIPRLVGTAAPSVVEDKRRYMAAEWCAHVVATKAFRKLGL